MSDSESPSSPRPREGFERRWIKNANYTGPERRSGADRRQYPPSPGGDAPQTPLDGDGSGDAAGSPPAQESSESGPDAPETPPDKAGTFKPYRP